MRLSCPGCQTEYEVPDAALAGRVRTLRCANCGHQWEYGPLVVTLPTLDPAAAAWPGAAPRSVFSETPKPAEPEIQQRASYEPLDTPARESWPPPQAPAEAAATAAYEPLTARDLAPEFNLSETGDEPANDEPESLPAASLQAASPASAGMETETKPAAGNEERFAALVKTSRNEPEFIEPRPRIRAGLFTTIILLIGICGGIWTARFHIMQFWPPSTRLFDAINLIIANLTTPPHH